MKQRGRVHVLHWQDLRFNSWCLKLQDFKRSFLKLLLPTIIISPEQIPSLWGLWILTQSYEYNHKMVAVGVGASHKMSGSDA